MLAGIPKGPSVYSPLNDYDRAKSRQVLILHAMEETKVISSKEAEAAAGEKLVFTGAILIIEPNRPLIFTIL